VIHLLSDVMATEIGANTNYKLLYTKGERNASIGPNVTVLPGIVIGEGAIVGADSVLTRDVPPFAIVVGNPAKVLRFSEKKNG
jgi:UDP-2-acetamido-3-amino-2,3-dideoxy-glucuronate N-acetyltransferase